jgi:hypothetical protein
MGEEPAHFLNMMDGNFITLQVGVIIIIIIVIIIVIIMIIMNIIMIMNIMITYNRGVLRERSPLSRTKMESCSSSI